MNPAFPYADLLDLSYPDPDRIPDRELLRKYPRSSLSDRAKIFNPFAAVSSHKKAVAAVQKFYRTRVELSEERRQELDSVLLRLTEEHRNGGRPLLSATYFIPAEKVTADYREEGIPDDTADDFLGTYRTLTGILTKIKVTEYDPDKQYLILRSKDGEEEKIPLREICAVRICEPTTK